MLSSWPIFFHLSSISLNQTATENVFRGITGPGPFRVRYCWEDAGLSCLGFTVQSYSGMHNDCMNPYPTVEKHKVRGAL